MTDTATTTTSARQSHRTGQTSLFVQAVRLVCGRSSPDQLIERAQDEALLKRDGNHAWLNDPSLIALQHFAAKHVGRKQRHNGGVLELTHYVEVADQVANTCALKTIPIDVRCFIAYGHDLVEELGEKHPHITPNHIVEQCWKGDPEHARFVVDRLTAITDTPTLHKQERMDEQLARAKADPTGITAYTRYYDKLCTYARDVHAFEQYAHKGQPLPKWFRVTGYTEKYKDKLDRREALIRQLPISEAHKMLFITLGQSLRQHLAPHLEQHPPSAPATGVDSAYSPGRRAFVHTVAMLPFIRFVRPSL